MSGNLSGIGLALAQFNQARQANAQPRPRLGLEAVTEAMARRVRPRREEDALQIKKPTQALERYAALLMSETHSDVTLEVGAERVRIPGHRLILGIASEPFKHMFLGDSAYAESQADVIILPEDDPEVMRTLLRFIYTGTCNLSAGNLFNVLAAARRHGLDAIETGCHEAIRTLLSNPNQVGQIGVFYSSAVALRDETLLALVENHIDEHAKSVLGSAGVRSSLGARDLQRLFSRDTLQISEIDLFRSVDLWFREHGDASATDRAAMLACVRLPLLTIGQLTSSEVLDSGHFTPEEILRAVTFQTRGQLSTSLCLRGAIVASDVYIDGKRSSHFWGKGSKAPAGSVATDVYKAGGIFCAKHCFARLEPSGEVCMYDLCSTGSGAVTVDGSDVPDAPKPIQLGEVGVAHRRIALRPGQVIKIGREQAGQLALSYTVQAAGHCQPDVSYVLPEQFRPRRAAPAASSASSSAAI
jgi:hypothetical protein